MPKRRYIKRKILMKLCRRLESTPEAAGQQLRHVVNTMERLASGGSGIIENHRLQNATGFDSDRAGLLIWALHEGGHIKWCPKIADRRQEGWMLK